MINMQLDQFCLDFSSLLCVGQLYSRLSRVYEWDFRASVMRRSHDFDYVRLGLREVNILNIYGMMVNFNCILYY